MIAESEELRREIKSEKVALIENLNTLESKAREMTDWRAQVAKHPWQALGAAVAAGAVLGLLMGRRRPSARSSEDESDDAPSPRRKRQSHPVIDGVVDAVVGVATAQAMQLVDEVVPGLVGAITRTTDGTKPNYSN